MKFDYFYGTEADQYSFYRIPKILFTNDYFKTLSSDAKVLYGLMLDRMALSIKNQWFDEKNRAYIYFSIENIMELLNCGRNKAIKSLQELDVENGIGLVEKRRQGFGKSNIIYVKNFMAGVKETEKFEKQTSVQENIATEVLKINSENPKNQGNTSNNGCTEVLKGNFKKFQKQTSRSPKNKLQEVYKTNSNNTNMNNIYRNENESNPILSDDEQYENDEMRSDSRYEKLIKKNIDYASLMIVHKEEQQLIQGIYELILETVLWQSDKILIASNKYSSELVRSKFLKLNYWHIEYVIECLKKNTTKVKNIKKYMLATLFNASATIDGYYMAEVNHDMKQSSI